jgi:hypothetical protein
VNVLISPRKRLATDGQALSVNCKYQSIPSSDGSAMNECHVAGGDDQPLLFPERTGDSGDCSRPSANSGNNSTPVKTLALRDARAASAQVAQQAVDEARNG